MFKTFSVPKGTMPLPLIPRSEPKSTTETRAIYSRAPACMGFGRPAQNSAGQP